MTDRLPQEILDNFGQAFRNLAAAYSGIATAAQEVANVAVPFAPMSQQVVNNDLDFPSSTTVRDDR